MNNWLFIINELKTVYCAQVKAGNYHQANIFYEAIVDAECQATEQNQFIKFTL